MSTLIINPPVEKTLSPVDITRVGDEQWEIGKIFRSDMRVPARFYSSPGKIKDVFKDRALMQLVNVTTLPGIVKYALAMPDMHQGYGFPIGGVAATLLPGGVISPGGIGYDINCGVRLLLSGLGEEQIKTQAEALAHELSRAVPSGTGHGGKFVLGKRELQKVLKEGASWALQNGLAESDDIMHTESQGRLAGADPRAVSELAKKRGHSQLGTLGAGNHFLEIGVVSEIFDTEAAKAFGLNPGQVTVLIHTGSRGLGHQVASDYIKLMAAAMADYNIHVPDRELACLPFNSELGQKYYGAMSAAANFAWVNRQLLTHITRQVWHRFFGISADLKLLYDVSHNMAKVESYPVRGKMRQLLVQRKGATRSFGPEHPDIPKDYRDFGQPVIIPGSMGTASYVLRGTEQAMFRTFGSSCHGAGRQMSRHKAKKIISGSALQQQLAAGGIIVKAASLRGLPEEAPYAYKDINDVVNIVSRAKIASKVARLRPLIVIKG